LRYKLGFSFALAAAFLALIGTGISFEQEAELLRNSSITWLSETIFQFHARYFISIAITCTVAAALCAINRWWVQVFSVAVLSVTMISLYGLARSFLPVTADEPPQMWIVIALGFSCIVCAGTAMFSLGYGIVAHFTRKRLQ
jgi:hypothetical protein